MNLSLVQAPPTLDTIPLVDLAAQHHQIAEELVPELLAHLESAQFVGGATVAAFEAEFAAAQDVDHCIGVANGTDALELSLRAAGIGPGDEVILPANTFFATAEAVVHAGAQPVCVDCDPVYGLIDPDAVEAAITASTAAIIPVHLYGQLAPMEPLLALARRFGLLLIEDAAQAQGASQLGRLAGSWGIAAGTSFYPGKNLGAYGDAGAVLTNDPVLAQTVRVLGNHGSARKYSHDLVGRNSRLDTLQALVLRVKLRHLPEWNAARGQAAMRYHDLLAEVPHVVTPSTVPGNEHVWHLYVIEVDPRRRSDIVADLNRQGIGVGVHYPTPVHLQPALTSTEIGRHHCPVAERLAGGILSLPLSGHTTESQQERVVASLQAALKAVL